MDRARLAMQPHHQESDMSDRITELERENALLREALRAEWESNHAEHCAWDWPHHEGQRCHWPLPDLLQIDHARP
jgi:hypothetical protein